VTEAGEGVLKRKGKKLVDVWRRIYRDGWPHEPPVACGESQTKVRS
jgi:hypothetical protein